MTVVCYQYSGKRQQLLHSESQINRPEGATLGGLFCHDWCSQRDGLLLFRRNKGTKTPVINSDLFVIHPLLNRRGVLVFHLCGRDDPPGLTFAW